MTAPIHITLSEPLRTFVEEQAAKAGYHDSGDPFLHLADRGCVSLPRAGKDVLPTPIAFDVQIPACMSQCRIGYSLFNPFPLS